MTTQDPLAALREAAQAVLDNAETDDNFDGEFIDYLVPAEQMDALRAALAATPPAIDPPALAGKRAGIDYPMSDLQVEGVTEEEWVAFHSAIEKQQAPPAIDPEAARELLDAANSLIENNYRPDPGLTFDVARWDRLVDAVNAARETAR